MNQGIMLGTKIIVKNTYSAMILRDLKRLAAIIYASPDITSSEPSVPSAVRAIEAR
jgi:hypothetical protein